MNIPNILTIIRILSVPVFVICLFYDRFWVALLIFVGAGITDGLDGLIARVYHQRTTTGAYLDPIADKLLLATAFIVLAILGNIPVWLTVIVIAKDVIVALGVLILFLTSRRVEVKPVLIGKTTTPEFGWKGVTDSPLTGITRNPWNPKKTPGGFPFVLRPSFFVPFLVLSS